MSWFSIKPDMLASLAKQAMEQAKEGMEKATAAIDSALEIDPNAINNGGENTFAEFDGGFFIPPPTSTPTKPKKSPSLERFPAVTPKGKERETRENNEEREGKDENESRVDVTEERDVGKEKEGEGKKGVRETEEMDGGRKDLTEEVMKEETVLGGETREIDGGVNEKEGEVEIKDEGENAKDMESVEVIEKEDGEKGVEKEKKEEAEKESRGLETETNEAQQGGEEEGWQTEDVEQADTNTHARKSIPAIDADTPASPAPPTPTPPNKATTTPQSSPKPAPPVLPHTAPPSPATPAPLSPPTHKPSAGGKLAAVPSDHALLEQRERQLMSLARQNGELQEEVERLRQQMGDLTTEREGATGEVERVVQERDMFRNELEKLRKTHGECKRTEEELQELLAEKEEEVAGLMAEGTALSKQMHTRDTALKKTRVDLRETEMRLERLVSQLRDKEAVVERQANEIKELRNGERNMKDALQKINDVSDAQGRDLLALRRELASVKDNEQNAKARVVNLERELEEVRLDAERRLEEAVGEAMSSGQASQQGAREAMETERERHNAEKEALLSQMDELRGLLEASQQHESERERHHASEIATLQSRLQGLEERAGDFAGDIAIATQPLLRQIEAMRLAHEDAMGVWEDQERALMTRIDDLQTQLDSALRQQSQLRTTAEQSEERLRQLQSTLENERREKQLLTSELTLATQTTSKIQHEREAERARQEALRAAYEREKDEYAETKYGLEKQIAQSDARIADLKAQISDLERKCAQLEETVRVGPGESAQEDTDRFETDSVRSGTSGLVMRTGIDPGHHFGLGAGPTRHVSSSVIIGGEDFVRSGTNVSQEGDGEGTVVSQLRFALRQREGEVISLQRQLGDVEASRAALAEELARAHVEIEDARMQCAQVPDLREQVKEMERKYNTALQMYGERAEQAEELRLDLLDVKEMYRNQIADLMARLERGGVR